MKRLTVVGLALLAASCGEGLAPVAPTSAGCSITISGSGNSAACGNSTQTTAPSPTPAPSPGQVTDCRVDWIRRGGPDFIPAGGEATFSITPMQTFKDAAGATQEVEVSAPCNNARPAPVWASSDTRVATVIPFNTGFEAKAKRLATGGFTITAVFEGRTAIWGVQ